MARLVKLSANGPVKIDPATWPRDEQGNLKNVWVCACGLSKTFPFCDATHKKCREEQAGCVYEYNAAGEVVSCKPETPTGHE
jgi:CDGSH-type Zn-finger protein